MIKIAICDDEEYSIKHEAYMITSVMKKLNEDCIIDEYINPLDLINTEKNYDMIFLDVEINEFNGINIANKVRNLNKNCFIFFVTNHEKYLDNALNERAFRFWTKPLDMHRLLYGIKSALYEIEIQCKKIQIHIGNNLENINIHNVIYIYVNNKKTHIITKYGEFISTDSFKKIFEQVKEIDFFCETARGYIVNFNFIKRYTKNNVSILVRDDEHKVDISRRKYKEFYNKFINYIGRIL